MNLKLALILLTFLLDWATNRWLTVGSSPHLSTLSALCDNLDNAKGACAKLVEEGAVLSEADRRPISETTVRASFYEFLDTVTQSNALSVLLKKFVN